MVVTLHKARMAQRVLEILDYFDDQRRWASVTEISDYYDRPQSSTSELVASLITLGLLHKDKQSRLFAPTIRTALLGTSSQPAMIRDGRLSRLLDRLGEQKGFEIALFSIVENEATVIAHRSPRKTPDHDVLRVGQRCNLLKSPVGMLLLATLDQARLKAEITRLVRREAEHKSEAYVRIADRVSAQRKQAFAIGLSGFGPDTNVMAVSIPSLSKEQPVAVGYAFSCIELAEYSSLLKCLQEAVESFGSDGPDVSSGELETFNNR